MQGFLLEDKLFSEAFHILQIHAVETSVCQGILQELNKNYEIIKQVTNSLMKFHQLTATSSVPRDAGGDVALSSDRRYSHQDVSIKFESWYISVLRLFASSHCY